MIVKTLFDSESNSHIPPLVKLVVYDKAVHPGPQDKCLTDGRADEMEEGVLILCSAFVQFFEISIQWAGVDVNIDICLVVCAIGHQCRHDPVHGGNILQPDTVFPVAPFFLVLCHIQTSVTVFVLYACIIANPVSDCK